MNNRLKCWGILKQMYCHDVGKHGGVFRSIVVITQLAINNCEELIHCDYRDLPWKNIVDARINSI